MVQPIKDKANMRKSDMTYIEGSRLQSGYKSNSEGVVYQGNTFIWS